MAFNGYRRNVLIDRDTVAKLAAGEKPRRIAADLGVSYSTLRRRLSRHVKAIGCTTPEQAVAEYVLGRAKAVVPTAVQPLLDRILKR
jgi:IS30 family transposase